MTSMRIQTRGVVLELLPGDPREAVIESLLFPSETPAPEPEPEPLPVPEAWREFWATLPTSDRRLLRALSEGVSSPAELEKIAGARPGILKARHRRIKTLALRFGIVVEISAHGYSRKTRRFLLDEQSRELVERVRLLPPPC